ncbi:MAG: hypothetical protein K9W44_17095 [Candidatus Lokiarchaeota archaeon]|nr:hypothetical protein [Candidatus Harpocratesius repetitus]
MKKIVVIIGSIIVLISIFLPFADMTLGWWEHTQILKTFLGDTITKTYLSPFGTLSNDANTDTTQIEGSILIIASAGTILGALIAIIGGFMDKNLIAFLGALVIILGLAYFVYSLGNIPEIRDLLYDESASAIFGKNLDIFIIVGTADLKWRLGNGFFIAATGALVTFVGTIIKEK